MNRLHPQQVHHHPGHGGHHHPAAGHPGHPIGYNKDDIYNWFRTLNNWNRIDLMCGLLDLCHPFEVKIQIEADLQTKEFCLKFSRK